MAKVGWKKVEGIKAMIIVSGFPDSEKLSLINRLLLILESEFDPIN